MSQVGKPFSAGDLATPQGRESLLVSDSSRRSEKAKRLRVIGSGDGVSDLPTNDDLLRAIQQSGQPKLPFTGERVVPGEVETQLWNEHVSRYRFACLFCDGSTSIGRGLRGRLWNQLTVLPC
jgi:hypothetical protein